MQVGALATEAKKITSLHHPALGHAMEVVLLPLELGGCGTMDPATNLAKDVAVDTLAGLQHPASAARRGYTVRTEEATRERPMGGDDSATLGEETVRGLANVQLHYRGQQDLPPVRAPGELVREERARCALPQRASEILEAAPPPGPPGPLPSGLS